MSDTRTKLFSSYYDGPDFSSVPTLRNFRRRLMNAAQWAVSCGQPLVVDSTDPNLPSEFISYGGSNYNDLFMFDKDGNWLKNLHRVGNNLYRILPQDLNQENLSISNKLIQIPNNLGFHLNFANKLQIPTYADLAVYGMNLR